MNRGVAIGEHYSVSLEEDDEGWFHARCNCGWDFGAALPSAEDACDALIDHAYEAGVAAALSSPETE